MNSTFTKTERKWIAVIGAFVSVACMLVVATGVWIFRPVDYDVTANPTEAVASNLLVKMFETKTPKPPTQTPLPTYTQFPTYTPEPTQIFVNTEYEYIETIHEVTRVVVWSPTPRPATATLRPTATPTDTPIPIGTQKAENDIAVQMRIDNMQIGLAEFFLSPAFISVLALTIAIIWAVGYLKNMERPTLETTHETADNISENWKFYAKEIVMLIMRSMQEYGAESNKLVGYRSIEGWSGEYWQRIISQMQQMGCPVVTEERVGTYLQKGSLRKWYMYFVTYSPSESESAVQSSVLNSRTRTAEQEI